MVSWSSRNSELRALPELIAITTGRGFARERASAAEAVTAGLPGILLRQPAWSDRELLSFAQLLRSQCQKLWIGVHDRAHLILAPEIDAVHLGYRSLRPSEVREFLPAGKQVGFSAHVHDEPEAWLGADYLFFSPVKPTPSKAGLLEPVGFDGLRRACSSIELPVIALGGLTSDDVANCLAAGARGVACLSGILQAESPGEEVAGWLGAFGEQRERRA